MQARSAFLLKAWKVILLGLNLSCASGFSQSASVSSYERGSFRLKWDSSNNLIRVITWITLSSVAFRHIVFQLSHK